jgi:hypothetical protein
MAYNKILIISNTTVHNPIITAINGSLPPHRQLIFLLPIFSQPFNIIINIFLVELGMHFALKNSIKMHYDNQALEDNHDCGLVLYTRMAGRKCQSLPFKS